ncbi:hypothetical protein HCN44_000945 [Aphidius gifuensis]|uniref:LEM domain-containing protein n=1 Tax=Aphidius gifuensis TaxID=684658 RepID=A0A834XMQ2_APHGI|nr:inner nuclear membrane protein Man1-like [Aphidius gifuensis]KAF7988372.1 hypothetical protein HCN44_000945 [Aphidius gifuensis]
MSAETFTDQELRTKLASFGHPIVPVTPTTRKILIKKLNNLMASKGGSGGSRHSLAARYSSDETDDDTSSTTNRKKKLAAVNRRQTMANPMPPPAAAPPPPPASSTTTTSSTIINTATGGQKSPTKRRTASRNSESKEIQSEFDDDVSTNSTSRGSSRKEKLHSKTSSKNNKDDGLETGSDSDLPDDDYTKPYSPIKYKNNTESSSSTKITTTTTSTSTNNFDLRKDILKLNDNDSSSKSTYESKRKLMNNTKDDKYISPPFKPDISPIPMIKDDKTYKRDDLKVNDLLANYESPYLSDFTRRLSSQTAGATLPSRTSVKTTSLRHSLRPEAKDLDTNGHYSNYRSTFNTSTSRYAAPTNDRPRDIVTRAFKTPVNTAKDDTRNNNQNMISMVLVIVLALFFGVIAVVYLGLGGKTETFPSLPAETGVPLCSQSDHDKPGVNCLLKENVATVMQLLKKIRPILVRKSISSACDDKDERPYITDSEVISMLKSNKVKPFEITSDLHNAQLLIFENPKWGISLIEIDDKADVSSQVLDSMEKVFQARLEGKVGMIMTNVDLPINCLIKRKVFTVLSTIIIIAIGLAAAFGIHKLTLWYIKYKKSTENEIYQLVSEIISMVELHYQNSATTSPGGSQESYVAINHVRDNLIPPKDRKKMSSIWEKALKFIDENESRIRREVQQVSGEEFYVWRWLPNLNTSNTSLNAAGGNNNTKKTKVWQGQAFETMEGSVNSLAVSPTPCLKMRHMFDPDVEIEDDWEVKIQDAVLEKCGDNVKVLHIRVDRGSREGCVYVKCMTHEDAGKAYRALHGCWFDGKLVTVKYLRLERYHERYPDAIRCSQPLKPSNNLRSSLQSHQWQNSLEAI